MIAIVVVITTTKESRAEKWLVFRKFSRQKNWTQNTQLKER